MLPFDFHAQHPHTRKRDEKTVTLHLSMASNPTHLAVTHGSGLRRYSKLPDVARIAGNARHKLINLLELCCGQGTVYRSRR